MTDALFITGTDTNVGKTLLSALLVAALDAVYWKPIQTGASEGTDRRTVIRWAGVPESQTLAEFYRFDPPVSPHLAAEKSGVRIEIGEIPRPDLASGKSLIVEGAGGILVPITDTESMLDLVWHLDMPVIVAARSALGTINHTRLTVYALRTSGIRTIGVVAIGEENRDNERAIERFAAVPVIGRIPMLETINRDALIEVYRSKFDRRYFE